MVHDPHRAKALYLKYLAKRSSSHNKLVRSALQHSGGDLTMAQKFVRRELVADEVRKFRARQRAARIARIMAGETVAYRVVRRRMFG